MYIHTTYVIAPLPTAIVTRNVTGDGWVGSGIAATNRIVGNPVKF